MDKKLSIKLFKFNHKTDYLPYYKSYEVIFFKNETVQDLLEKIEKIETFEFKGTEDYGVKINNLFLNITTPIQEIVDKTSNELLIEPVSTYRAIHDLHIKNDDFFQKMDLFDQYLTKEQKETYSKELQLYYYASNTLNFHKNYIGDHVVIIASDIIKTDPIFKDNIIDILSDKDKGIWYHTSLMKRIHNIDENQYKKIERLLIEITKLENKSTKEYLDDITDTIQDFGNFNIAVYDRDNTGILKKIVQNSKATFVDTFSQNNDLAFSSLRADKQFTYKLAGQVLLDAIDNNADFIIVNDEQNFTLFDKNQKEIAKVVGRDINLPIVTAKQFNEILCGEKDHKILGFHKHSVPIPFL